MDFLIGSGQSYCRDGVVRDMTAELEHEKPSLRRVDL